jgi:hypothetical protein
MSQELDAAFEAYTSSGHMETLMDLALCGVLRLTGDPKTPDRILA